MASFSCIVILLVEICMVMQIQSHVKNMRTYILTTLAFISSITLYVYSNPESSATNLTSNFSVSEAGSNIAKDGVSGFLNQTLVLGDGICPLTSVNPLTKLQKDITSICEITLDKYSANCSDRDPTQ